MHTLIFSKHNKKITSILNINEDKSMINKKKYAKTNYTFDKTYWRSGMNEIWFRQ